MYHNDKFNVSHRDLNYDINLCSSNNMDTVFNTVRDHGIDKYEEPFTNIIIEILKINPGIFMDVGANTGLYSLIAAAVDESIEVLAFEPLDSVRELLDININLNPHLASRIKVEPFALSQKKGTFQFYETINKFEFISTSSSLEKRHAAEVGDSYVERKIKTCKLNDYLKKVGEAPISFIKIDVEGHEHAVISGGRKFFAEKRPIFSVEILANSEKETINNFVKEENYLTFSMNRKSLRQCSKVEFFSDAWNHLVVPAEKINQIFQLCRALDLRIDIYP